MISTVSLKFAWLATSDQVIRWDSRELKRRLTSGLVPNMTAGPSHLSFQNLLSRADDGALQELVGLDVVRLLRSIDPALATPTGLRDLLNEFKEPTDLLRDSGARKILMDLLPIEVARSLCETLELATFDDPFDVLRNLNPRRRSPIEEKFLTFFGLDVPPEAGLAPHAESVLAKGKYQLFDHQRRAVSQVRRTLTSDSPRVLLHMPTGSGKTRTAMNLISEHLRNHEPALVVWLAYSDRAL